MSDKLDPYEKCQIHNHILADKDIGNWQEHVKRSADKLDVSAAERDRMVNQFGEFAEQNRKRREEIQDEVETYRAKQRIIRPDE